MSRNLKNYQVTGKFTVDMDIPSGDLLEKMKPAIEAIDLSKQDGDGYIKGKGVEMISAQSSIRFAIIAEVPILARNMQDAVQIFYRQARDILGPQLDKSMDVDEIEVVGAEYVSDAE